MGYLWSEPFVAGLFASAGAAVVVAWRAGLRIEGSPLVLRR